MSQYPIFSQTVKSLGATDEERGRAMGVSYKTASRYRAGELPKPVVNWLNASDPQTAILLLQALLAEVHHRALPSSDSS